MIPATTSVAPATPAYSLAGLDRSISALPGSLCDREELFRHRGQHLVPALGHDDQVLDPDSEPPGHVHARLDRDDVAAHEPPLAARREPGRLVDLETDAVPGAVPELVFASGFVDPGARCRVDFAHVRPGGDTGERRRLRHAHELVALARLGVELAGREGPRAVGAVSVDAAPEVDDHERVRRALA